MAKHWKHYLIQGSIPSILENGMNPGLFRKICIVSREVGGTLFYDASKKRIVKIETIDAEKNALTTFDYDDEGKFKVMNTSVISKGKETTVSTEILLLRNSAKFPDRLFEF
jgi:hypothetical protein